MTTRGGPDVSRPQRWSALDFGLHSFIVVAPFGLGFWMFSLAPLVGGNLFLAVLAGGAIVVLGAIVYGSLAGRWPWAGGDYAWQTRFLGTRLGAIVALAAWWLAVAAIAPVYGNLILVQVVDPLLVYGGWHGLAEWFRTRDGIFVCSLIAIALATAFVGIGMRRAAIVQRVLVCIGLVAVIAVFALLFAGGPEFRDVFDEESAEFYGTSPLASSQIAEIGSFDADITAVEPGDTFRLVPLVLLFSLWIGWAAPLAGEIRIRRPDALRVALFRVATVSTLLGLLFLVAIGRGNTWELWNEANNLYWGTVYATTPATPLATWPNPVVFATWLTESSVLRIAVIVGMAAWVVGLAATLFLSASRVLMAAAADGNLPVDAGRPTADRVQTTVLAFLVVPACALAALDAYWSSFGSWTAIAVVALAASVAASGFAAVVACHREQRYLAATAGAFAVLVLVATGTWLLDPVFGLRSFGPFVLLACLYAISAALVLGRGRTPTMAAADTRDG
jgi:amino acid transporter